MIRHVHEDEIVVNAAWLDKIQADRDAALKRIEEIEKRADWRESVKPPSGLVCLNCGAAIGPWPLVMSSEGVPYCCRHCAFNPLGCQCKYGEFGKPGEGK